MLMVLAFQGLAIADVVTALASVGEQLSAAQTVLTQSLRWVSDIDARLLGCPTIVVEPH
jgi:hypothetical protein